MCRKSVPFSVVLLILATLLFAGGSGHSAAQDTTDDRVAALETQVAELEATVAALAGTSGSATETVPEEGTLSETSTEVPTASASQSATDASNLSGNAFDLLPPGNAGELAVVSNGV